MTKDLEKIQEQWLKDYIPSISQIWAEWRDGRDNPGWGKMSMRERDELLGWYRQKLFELKQGQTHSLSLPERPKPRDEEEWLSEVEI